ARQRRAGATGELMRRVRPRDAASVSASADGQPIRLLPLAEAGAYHGQVTAAATTLRTSIDLQVIDAAGRATTARRTVPTAPDAHHVAAPAEAPLSLLSASHGGIDVRPARIGDVERFARAIAPPPPAPAEHHPMRSPWWLAPFAGCLFAEWWLRRRFGLR